MNTFVLATDNEDKVREIRQVLEGYGVTLLARPRDVPEVVETELTLEGNALLKARTLTDATGEAAIADDTGLFVDHLDGRPGVFSARYAGEGASFEANVQKLLRELSSMPGPQRGAHFRTVIAVTSPHGESWWVEGVLSGSILETPRGEGGFGYDPIFAPDNLGGRSLSELSLEEKNELSHRGTALRAFVKVLEGSRDAYQAFTRRVEE